MNAARYNEHAIRAGNITIRDIGLLTEYYQQSFDDLDVDGKLGPKTREHLRRGDRETPVSAIPGTTLGERALDFIRLEVGRGEDRAWGNNRGPDIDRILRNDGTGRPAITNPHERGSMAWAWCAALVSMGLVLAAKDLGRTPPPTSRGALDLRNKLKRWGAIEIAPEDVKPGDVIIIDRGRPDDNQAHALMAETESEGGIVGTIEGNVGKHPAVVRRLTRDLYREPVLAILRVV